MGDAFYFLEKKEELGGKDGSKREQLQDQGAVDSPLCSEICIHSYSKFCQFSTLHEFIFWDIILFYE